jgi:hypothetical protein
MQARYSHLSEPQRTVAKGREPDLHGSRREQPESVETGYSALRGIA